MGAVVTPDDRLIVTYGSSIAALDATGTSRVLCEIPGETIRTPAVPAGPRRLLVATNRALWELVPAE